MRKTINIFFALFCLASAAAQEVKLVTYNIRLDHAGDGEDNWHKRKAELANFVIDQKPDFFDVQESMHIQNEYLKEKLTTYKNIGVGREDGKTKGEYSSIFYDFAKWKCIKDSTFWLSETPSIPSKGWDASFERVCTFGIFTNKEADTIVVSNTHFDHMGVIARKNSVQLMLRHMQKYAAMYPVLLTGDFNFTPQDSLYKDITSGLTDLATRSKTKQKHEGTFNNFKLNEDYINRIDYVYYYRNQWFADKYTVLEPKTSTGRQLSDHFPVIAVLKSKRPYKYEEYVQAGDTLRYRALYPKNFDKTKKYPLVVFMHGSGERGSENENQLTHGGKLFLDSIEKYPAIVLFPQLRKENTWAIVEKRQNRLDLKFIDTTATTPDMGLLLNLIDQYRSESYIDNNRFYVSGLSMGGMGTWELLWRIPEKIAAAMPICGAGLTTKGNAMKNVPIWAFHGAADSVVPIYHSLGMLQSAQKAGGIAKISIYEGVNHNSWDYAFAEKDFLKWMFSKSKKIKK